MSDITQIPTVEVKLPETGVTVKIRKYLTTGQSRELQKIILKGGKFDAQQGTFSDLDPVTFMEMQDKATELLIIEYTDKAGATSPFNQEWLYNLPGKDGQVLYEEINKITQESTLTQEQRKNS